MPAGIPMYLAGNPTEDSYIRPGSAKTSPGVSLYHGVWLQIIMPSRRYSLTLISAQRPSEKRAAKNGRNVSHGFCAFHVSCTGKCKAPIFDLTLLDHVGPPSRGRCRLRVVRFHAVTITFVEHVAPMLWTRCNPQRPEVLGMFIQIYPNAMTYFGACSTVSHFAMTSWVFWMRGGVDPEGKLILQTVAPYLLFRCSMLALSRQACKLQAEFSLNLMQTRRVSHRISSA